MHHWRWPTDKRTRWGTTQSLRSACSALRSLCQTRLAQLSPHWLAPQHASLMVQLCSQWQISTIQNCESCNLSGCAIWSASWRVSSLSAGVTGLTIWACVCAGAATAESVLLASRLTTGAVSMSLLTGRSGRSLSTCCRPACDGCMGRTGPRVLRHALLSPQLCSAGVLFMTRPLHHPLHAPPSPHMTYSMPRALHTTWPCTLSRPSDSAN